jgi:polysaccharide export outer membrane protein
LIKRTPLIVLATIFAIAGCTNVIPGLNVDEGHAGGHAYHVVESKDNTGYAVVPGSPQFAYDVVAITPESLSDLVAGAGADDAPPASALKPLAPAEVPPEYKVGPGDVIFITVWDHPELTLANGSQVTDFVNGGRLVAADGTAFYPFVGTFTVAGKTTEQLRQEITKSLARVIEQPQVGVRVVAFRSKRIQVTGEVISPGTVTLDDTAKGVLQAISERGGLTPLASRRRVLLVRGGKTYTVDLAALLTGSRPGENIALAPGDNIQVPDQSGDQVFVLGAVLKQQPVIIQQDSMTLIQALTSSGGLDNLRARDSGVLVFRRSRESAARRPIIYTLDMSNPQGMLLAGEFPLKPRDVVYVKATAFAQYNAVIAQLLPTVQTIFEITDATYLVKHQ